MRTFILALVGGLLIVDGAMAAVLDSSKISSFSFRDAKMGQPPFYDMTCDHGYCKSQAPGGDGRVKVPYNVFARVSDPSSIAGIEISTPKYYYWKDQLFRITFFIKCNSDNTDECFDLVLYEISREDMLILLANESVDFVAIDQKMSGRSFVSTSGALLSAVQTENKGDRELLIDIWDKKLRDELNLNLNPKYRAVPVSVPEK